MSVPDDAQVRSLIEAAERAFLQGQAADSDRLLATARSLAPDHPAVLGASGTQALRSGDAATAKGLIERALETERSSPGLYLNLATALRTLDDPEGELRALQQALTLDPHFFLALIQKGSLLERQGKKRLAARTYQNALVSLNPGAQFPVSWQPLIEYARRAVFANLNDLDEWLRERMRETRERHGQARLDRVDHCLATIVGKKRIYVQQPQQTHFPHLPAIEFFDRSDFPWLAAVEGATEDIRQELARLLEE